MKILRGAKAGEAILARRGFGQEMTVPPAMAERIRGVFGLELTPEEAVRRIIDEVRQRGDAALIDYTNRIDGVKLDRLEVSSQATAVAYDQVDGGTVAALRLAAERVRHFHNRQRRHSWVEFDEGGLGQIILPVERVGVYAPGGTASYPSTVLMTAIPAKAAGVREVFLATPPRRDGTVSPLTLVAAHLAGVDRVFAVGGAQAIAALAWGTASIPKVDKICGPGNLFVVLAKRQVYGLVGIDGLPGPTETVIIADDSANPRYCALDLLAQAEHDPLSSAILITSSERLAKEVSTAVDEELATLERAEIAAEALGRSSAIVVVESLDEAFELANRYAPEHLCLLIQEPWTHLGKVRHAGGVFLGESSVEAVGDYVAGPSHVMPTGGTARFASPLSVDDFLKITSLVALNPSTLAQLGPATATLARAEGLTAHARAVEARLAASEGPGKAPRRRRKPRS